MTEPAVDSLWGLTWRRFRRSRLASLALLYVGIITMLALLAPLVANRKPLLQRTGAGWSSPALTDFWIDDPDIDLPPAAPTFTLHPPVAFSPNTIDLGA